MNVEGWKVVRCEIGGEAGCHCVIFIVGDGHLKANPCTLSAIAAIGAYKEAIATNVANGKPVFVHIYEFTTQSTWPINRDDLPPVSFCEKTASIAESNKLEGAERGIVPVQIIF
jgi:chitin synthase